MPSPRTAARSCRLLGGLAGVNAMAREIGAALGMPPAITTSGELRFGTCVLNPPEATRLPISSKANASCPICWRVKARASKVKRRGSTDAQLPRSESARLAIRVTPRAWDGRDDELVIHPRSVVAAVTVPSADTSVRARMRARSAQSAVNVSVGANASPDALTDSGARIAALVHEALNAHGLSPLSLAALLAPAEQMANPALADAAASLNVPLRFAHTRPEDGEPPSNLLHAALRVPYQTLHDGIDARDAGVALALAALAIDPDTIGHARGRLTVIGLGPGSADLMVPAARTALNEATDILGYETYVKMAGPLRTDQRVHGTDNREEMQRARHAFELASTGRSVVMVSSGDPGVFAMAAAVLEALEEGVFRRTLTGGRSNSPSCRGCPRAHGNCGASGAPLGHDFCMLSLSDNLKPWTIIEKRLRHTAEADLVMAFYNPISRARPWQLDKALDIVREYRAPRRKSCLVAISADPAAHCGRSRSVNCVRPMWTCARW